MGTVNSYRVLPLTQIRVLQSAPARLARQRTAGSTVRSTSTQPPVAMLMAHHNGPTRAQQRGALLRTAPPPATLRQMGGRHRAAPRAPAAIAPTQRESTRRAARRVARSIIGPHAGEHAGGPSSSQYLHARGAGKAGRKCCVTVPLFLPSLTRCILPAYPSQSSRTHIFCAAGSSLPRTTWPTPYRPIG